MHPIIEADLPAARVRVKRYKEMGVIDPSDSLASLARLWQQQARDFANMKRKQANQNATVRLFEKVALIQEISGGNDERFK